MARITESRIRQVIREEAGRLLREGEDFDGETGLPATPNGVAIKLRGILSTVDKSRLSEADRKLLGIIMKVIDPGDLKSAGFLQSVLGQISFEAGEVDRRKARAEADADLSRRIGAERQADMARRGIKSFDPNTGKPIYSEGRARRLQEGSSPAGVFNRIKDVCEEVLMNKSLGMKPMVADGAAERIRNALKDL